MVTVKIQGGLCNQLFQWAFGYSLSKLLNKELVLDVSFYRGGCSGCTPREFGLNNFKNLKLKYLEGETMSDFFKSDVFKVKDNHFFSDRDYLGIKGNILLDGYWQSEKYFHEHRNEIHKLLDFGLDDKFSDLDFTNSCSIHVRRTDYLHSPKYHTNLGLNYYRKALEKINPSGTIYVLSDDIEWCKNTFKNNNLLFIENNRDIEDLKLMSLCSDNIIANSSFSWWGAWLNKNPKKRIIAPGQWFGEEGPGSADIIPKTWDTLYE